MKKFLLSLMCAFVAFCANAITVTDLYKDFTTVQNIRWGSEAAYARISFSATDGLVYLSTEATANNWDAQYWIANGGAFMPENTYKVTMLIKGSVAGTIGNLKLGDWVQGVDNYDKFSIPADEYKEVSIEVSGVTGGDGILLQTGSYVGEFSIKWVKITHEDNRDASKFCLALTDIPAGTNAWDHQLQYPFDPALPAGDYTLSLDVKGDASGSMSIWGDYVEGANYGPGFDFGTTWETKTVDFNLAKDYKQFALVFGQYTGTSIWFDNIKIISKATGEDVLSADFASNTLEGFIVSGFWTNVDGWVQHIAKTAIVEAPEDDPEPEPEPWVCPEGEIDITTLPFVGEKDNKIGETIEGGTPVYGNQGDGSCYVDVTTYETVKFYGTPGTPLRIFVNRDGKGDVTVGTTEQDLTLNSDGLAVMNIQEVMDATGKEYCYLSSVKTGWGASAVKIDGITVTEKPAPYTILTTAGKIGTIVLDYPASVEGATLYSVASFGTSGLVLEEVEGDMVAGTPYIYQAAGDEVVCTKKGASIEHGDFTDENVGNGLRGMYVQLTPSTFWYDQIRNNGYIITGNKLRNIAQGNVTIPANRCFFDSSKCANNGTASSAKMIVIPADEATAITNVNTSLEDGKIYDINGREVKSMQKGGMYIIGGMKVYVK